MNQMGLNLKEIDKEEDTYKRRNLYYRYVKELLCNAEMDVKTAISVIDDHELKARLLRLKEIESSIRQEIGDITIAEVDEYNGF